jgi:uncharacterized protein (DUF58 family)
LLRALELSIARRIEGLLAGEHRSASIGIGTELALIRPYQPGDDVRRIDWKVTARTNHPHVRMQVAERTLTTWLVLDNSPSMIFGTADRRKWDVAEGVALAVGHVAARRGGRLGLLTYGDGAPIMRPPRQGRVGLRGALLALDHGPRSEPVGPTSLGDACRQLSGLARQRGVVVLVGDFRGPRDWEVPLGHLLSRHQVLAVEIRDRREHELPNVGELLLMDPETGRQLRVDTSLRRLRESYATTAAVEREEVAAIFRSVGVRHLVLFTSGDWLRELAGYLRRERRGW